MKNAILIIMALCSSCAVPESNKPNTESHQPIIDNIAIPDRLNTDNNESRSIEEDETDDCSFDKIVNNSKTSELAKDIYLQNDWNLHDDTESLALLDSLTATEAMARPFYFKVVTMTYHKSDGYFSEGLGFAGREYVENNTQEFVSYFDNKDCFSESDLATWGDIVMLELGLILDNEFDDSLIENYINDLRSNCTECSNSQKETLEKFNSILLKRQNEMFGSATHENSNDNTQYSINVQDVDSILFTAEQKKIKPSDFNFAKITNFQEAINILKGAVEFVEDDEVLFLKKINFRNGKEFEMEYNECAFVAYYPDEDILLCVGGHQSDMSFNLKNGEYTNDTGNPELIISSLNNVFRLNSSFEGQECYSYFIQKKVNDEYIKIIQLDKDFEDLTDIWLCTIGEAFWADEQTLFLTETDYVEEGIEAKYYRIDLVEK